MTPDVTAIIVNYNGGAETYDPLPRGEFFAVADASSDPWDGTASREGTAT